MCIVESPRDSIQHARNAILSHASSEQRVTLECAEGIVLDFGVRWRCALTDKVEVNVGAKRGRVEEDEPYIYAQFRLHARIVRASPFMIWHFIKLQCRPKE